MKTRICAGGMGVSLLLVICWAWAGTALRVEEEATRMVWRDSAYVVHLVVHNPSLHTIPANARLELVSPSERVHATAHHAQSLKPGRNVVELRLDLRIGEFLPSDRRGLIWHRLRYAVSAEGSPALGGADGIIAVGQVTPDVFELHAYAPQNVRPGEPFTIRVRAIHPVTRRAVSGVRLEAAVDDGDLDEPVAQQGWKRRSATTDGAGFAVMNFDLPPDAFDVSELDWAVSGRRGAFEDSVEDTAYISHRLTLLLLTDKPLYQPGQKLRLRLLALDVARRPVSGKEFVAEIKDPEGTLTFRAAVITSRFGVAHAEWEIPASLRLGDYSLKASPSDEGGNGEFAIQRVRISRYDLPAFAVQTKPDRSFYLPGQDAKVEVRADYLFGKPVERGTVRVVREASRHWDYKNQKWVTQEDASLTGELSAGGVLTAAIPLQEQHAMIGGDRDMRFADVNYAAYVTDTSTGRTEQRRFSLRVTREPIHVYVVDSTGDLTSGFPLDFYVTTSYADGRPAACEVEIRARQPLDEKDTAAGRTHLPRVAVVRTNRFGVARVAALDLSQLEESEPDELELRARDAEGAGGVQLHDLNRWNEQPALRVETNKTIYAPGEAIEVRLRSNVPDTELFIEAVTEGGKAPAQRARLRRGRAFAVLPPNPLFRGEVRVLAYGLGLPPSEDWDARSVAGSRVVIFPAQRDLAVNLRAEKAEYRPGEKAVMNVAVRRPSGASSENSLGVVVFDKAVEERARIEVESGNGAGAASFRSLVEEFLGHNTQLGGVRLSDLQRLDMSKPLPEGLDLVAEILLNQGYREDVPERNTPAGGEPHYVFSSNFRAALAPVHQALDRRFDATRDYPKDEVQLREKLAEAGVQWASIRDPWGTPFRATGSYYSADHVLQISSAGPDKQPNTGDDIAVERISRKWFLQTGEAIDRAAAAYYARTKQFIRDEATLNAELKRAGLDWNTLRDAWGHVLRVSFDVDGVYYTMAVDSPGSDGKFTERPAYWEDVNLWTNRQDYTNELRTQVDNALAQYFARTSRFPETEEETRAALEHARVPAEVLRDPWQQPYAISFSTADAWGDRVTIRVYGEGGESKTRGTTEPVTQRMRRIELRSNGRDRVPGTTDDFLVLSFSRALAERAGRAEVHPPSLLVMGGTGAITGEVTDATGAIIAGAIVTATHTATRVSHEVRSGDDGRYTLRNLPTGHYSLRVESPGFRDLVVQQVPVRSSAVTRVDAMLEVGAVSESVVVAESQFVLQTTNASVSLRSVDGLALLAPGLAAPGRERPQPLATPRLREHFPETLLWLPELETGRNGRARIEVPLADNITTWKVAAIASNLDGQIGVAEAEIRAFQPFFVEHDPPKVLTEGDEISLPVVLRNYLDKPLELQVEMKPESWFALSGAARKGARVAAGGFSREVFAFRAIASVKQGKQQVTAAAREAADAIEKSVHVHPDGEERVEIATGIFSGGGVLSLDLPRTMIPGSLDAQVKIYPNLASHVLESIEGILQRPYGCGEQTISSTYPNLLLLRYAKQSGTKSELTRRAERYLREGYERLLGYRSKDGGFGYWSGEQADLALSAYALRFLHDAREFLPIEDDLIHDVREFLAGEAQADGRWMWKAWNGQVNEQRAQMLTAYLARILATTAPQGRSDGTAGKEVARALSHLAPKVREWDEPYLLANFALAALHAGQEKDAREAVNRLRTMARDERGAAYWTLEGNTPFYGWGLPGRIETTALVIHALELAKESGGANAENRAPDKELINRGLLFLLRSKDRFGVWFSTQATVNVLDALLLLARNSAPAIAGGSTAELLVNGKAAGTLHLPTPNQLSAMLTHDVSSLLAPGANQIEVRGLGANPATVQLVAAHYVPWKQGPENGQPAAASGASGNDILSLKVDYDRVTAAAGETIQCSVQAERVGHRGYGMMVAEIGLPPGAEVNRASLTAIVERHSLGVRQYDVLPDRVVLYLWPQAGGTRLDFTFKVRYCLRAKASASILYDYYNPEARITVQPASFVIH